MTAEPSALETAELMLSCFKRVRHLVDSELSGCGLSISRTKLLSELSQNGPRQQGALATLFGLAPRTVTELIDTLERDGLVERRTDPADRRARQIHITPSGEQARAQGIAIREQIMSRVFGPLSPAQLADLAGALLAIQAELDSIGANDGAPAAPPESSTRTDEPAPHVALTLH